MNFVQNYYIEIIAVMFVIIITLLVIMINIYGELKHTREYAAESGKMLSDQSDSHWKHYNEMKEAYTKYGNECLQYAKDSRSVLLKYMLWIEGKYPDINDEFSKHITTQQVDENENIEGRV